MRIQDGYLVFDENDYLKNKKITATSLYSLLGKNSFKKKGDALLSTFGLYKEVVDPFIRKRGAIAESFIKNMLIKKGYEVKTWNPKEIGFDNFKNHKHFGGMIDIAVTSPERIVIECKSKNIKDLQKTQKYKNYDYETQAKFYQFMSKCPKGKLVYVFFTDEQEERIKNNQPINVDTEKFVVYGYDLTYDENEMKEFLRECLEYKIKCYAQRRIPLEDISEKVLVSLNVNGGN